MLFHFPPMDAAETLDALCSPLYRFTPRQLRRAVKKLVAPGDMGKKRVLAAILAALGYGPEDVENALRTNRGRAAD